MADIENTRRVIDQTKTTNMSTDDSFIIDSAVGGTRRVEYSDMANQLKGTLGIEAIKAKAEGAMQKSVYDANGNGIVDNAEKVNNHTVNSDVPENAVFTDTTYDPVVAGSQTPGLMIGSDKSKLDSVAQGATNVQVDTSINEQSNNPVTNAAIATALNSKQETLTFDQTPVAGSENPVTSGGIKTALDDKQDTLTFDSTPTAGSSKPVTSSGIKIAIDAEASAREAQTAIRHEIIDGWLYIAYYSVS